MLRVKEGRKSMLLIAIIGIVALLINSWAVGKLAFTIVRECGALQSAFRLQSGHILREIAFEGEVTRDYLVEILENKLLPHVGYKEPIDVRQDELKALLQPEVSELFRN
jgi:hypothetical protein